MAAQDYYNSFSTGPQGPSYPHQQPQPAPYPQSQLQQQRPPSFAPSTAPPPYSPGPYNGPRPNVQQIQQAPYFSPPPNNATLRPPGQGYDGSALKPARSYSSPPAEHRHHHHHHSSSDSSPSRSRSRSRDRRRSNSSRYGERGFERGYQDTHHRGSHKDMDTFLGAGGGAIIGDAIFPGLGTIGGLILGGVGGREYAKKKERSERSQDSRHSDSRRALRETDGGGGRRSRSSVPDYRYKE